MRVGYFTKADLKQQKIAEQAAKEIQKEINSITAQDTDKYLKINFYKIKEQIDTYLNYMDIIEMRMAIRTKGLILTDYQQNYIDSKKNDITPQYRRYLAAKEIIQENHSIEELLKDGYRIIEMIRELITGQTIVYRIGVDYRGTLYEKKMTMEEILSIAKVEPQWKNTETNILKLRLRSSKSALIKDLDKPNNEKRSTLYSSIRKYASIDKKWNKGNVYEAYRILVNLYGGNLMPPAKWGEEEFDKVYSMVQKNTASYVKGGDILNTQVKFFGTSMPSLTTLSTIETTLKSFSDLINKYQGSELIDEFNKIFTKEEDEIENMLENKILEITDDLVDILDFDN